MEREIAIEVKNLYISYRNLQKFSIKQSLLHFKKVQADVFQAVKDVSFEVEKGEFVAIMGSSGSGKTTLLNCISTIDKVTAGHIFVGGTDITKLKGNDLNKFRREDLGFIFQDFNLLDTLTAYENIALALSIQNVSRKKLIKSEYIRLKIKS